jgi:hypothetical protein
VPELAPVRVRVPALELVPVLVPEPVLVPALVLEPALVLVPEPVQAPALAPVREPALVQEPVPAQEPVQVPALEPASALAPVMAKAQAMELVTATALAPVRRQVAEGSAPAQVSVCRPVPLAGVPKTRHTREARARRTTQTWSAPFDHPCRAHRCARASMTIGKDTVRGRALDHPERVMQTDAA